MIIVELLVLTTGVLIAIRGGSGTDVLLCVLIALIIELISTISSHAKKIEKLMALDIAMKGVKADGNNDSGT